MKIDYYPYGQRKRIAGDETNFQFTGKELDESTGLTYFGARYYDASIGRWYIPDPAGQYWSPYIYCGNKPLVYIDENGEFAWWLPVLIGAAIGGTTGAVVSHNTGGEWWQGAIVGAFMGAGVGALAAPAIVGTASMTTSAGTATTGWGITTSIINSANLNMAFGSLTGASREDLWKFALTGAASGGFTATGGLTLAKRGFAARLGFQAIGTAGRSIGNNWASNRDLLSRVSVGIGPVNFTLGKGQKLLQAKNNIGNIIAHSIGFFSKEAEFDWSHLTYKTSEGWTGKLLKLFGNYGATGAYAVIGATMMPTHGFLAEELNHIWQSRSLGDSFLFNYLLQGLNAVTMGKTFDDNVNYYEKLARPNTWGY